MHIHDWMHVQEGMVAFIHFQKYVKKKKEKMGNDNGKSKLNFHNWEVKMGDIYYQEWLWALEQFASWKKWLFCVDSGLVILSLYLWMNNVTHM